jgi:hypothetical protein
MSALKNPPQRLLIGAASYTDAQGALKIAEMLARSLAVDLGGLLVEDTIVGELIERPGQRVVTGGGSILLAPSSQAVHTMMQREAKAFRTALAALAQAGSRKWFFEHRQGELISGLCSASRSHDLLLVGHSSLYAHARNVVFIRSSDAASEDAGQLARNLAQDLQATLVTLVLNSGASDPDTSDRDSESFTNAVAMLEWISRANISAVVLDLSAGPFREHAQVRQLLAAARCPVLMLGAENAIPPAG